MALEFCWSILHTAIIERRQHARVPVLSSAVIDFIITTIPESMMGMNYPGRHYGKPRETVTDLVQAIVIGENRRELVNVPMCAEPVPYVSLDWLFEEGERQVSAYAPLPIEEGAMMPPRLAAKAAAAMEAPRRSSVPGQSASVMTPQTGGRSAISKEPDGSSEMEKTVTHDEAKDVRLAEGGDDDSSPMVSLSPVGSLRSGDFSAAREMPSRTRFNRRHYTSDAKILQKFKAMMWG